MPGIRSGLAAAVILIVGAVAMAQSPSRMAETAAFAASLQNPDGGFAARPGEPSSLGATNSALKVLLFTAGSVPDVPACLRYVRSCVDKETGGIAPTPGGEPTVVSTAIGLMALSELKIATDDVVAPAIDYMSEKAKEFPDVRMAIAGMEAIRKESPAFDRWAELIRSMRNSDGTWGSGAERAFATGGAAAGLLRMGLDLDKQDAVIRAIAEGQREDGGWSEGEGPSTLSSSYRVARCVWMLKTREVDLDRLARFIADHRANGGGYSAKPGETPDLSNTYYAMIMTRWIRDLTGEPRNIETAGFVALFNGENLDGWEGDERLWSVKNGAIVGDSPGLDHNDFLATEEEFGDFIFRATFRIRGGDDANSGIMFRSKRLPGHEMSGYQADIGQGFWGCLYDESRRNRVLVQADPRAVERIHHDGWNEYVIRAIGNDIRLYLNGVQSVAYREDDDGIARSGKIAPQLHAGKPLSVEFKDLYLQRLPSPKAGGDPTAPGFHVRDLATEDGTRKYTVYVPEGYDPAKPWPVVLFLHGAGERGEDGIVPAQVGLGPAIARDPRVFPAIAVFPQARQTWAADSADARAAMAVLEDVKKTYHVDPDRIVLTGLSMGGHGSWDNAAAHPETFAGVAVICGFTREPDAIVAKVKRLPIWMVVGDADMERIFTSMRDMTDKLRDAGADLRSIEYRGIGHNSWDRAYNDPDLLAWMLSRKRQAR